jgi:hypothetical protein
MLCHMGDARERRGVWASWFIKHFFQFGAEHNLGAKAHYHAPVTEHTQMTEKHHISSINNGALYSRL